MEARITSVQYVPPAHRRNQYGRIDRLSDSIVRIALAVGIGCIGVIFVGIIIIGG